MSAQLKPKRFHDGHVTVRMRDCIVILSSRRPTLIGSRLHQTWTYNLWTEQWRRHITEDDSQLPQVPPMCGVAIDSAIYMFGGGIVSSNLWKLTPNTDGSFDWNMVCMENHAMPSPRWGHSCWEYGNKMWIFGGYGQSPVSYLNDHGDFAGPGDLGMNNQLFSYNPFMQTFTNMECSGEVPSPRAHTSSAVIKHKAWLYELKWGQDHELYELNMQCLTWTHIHTSIPKPQVLTEPMAICATASLLTPVTTNQLLLHGHSRDGKDTWIFDVESYQWREFKTFETCSCTTYLCSGASGLNSGAIVFVAHTDMGCNKSIFSLMLEPKSLQQLAMRIIHQNKTSLPWTCLPPPLRRKLETQ